MKCKYCDAELVDGKPFCPSCGKENLPAVEEQIQEVTPLEEMPAAEEIPAVEEAPAQEAEPVEEPAEIQSTAEIKEGIKATPGKIALAVVAVIVVLAVLIAVVLSGLSGNVQKPLSSDTNETVSGTEAVADTEETVAATIPADGNPDDVTCKGSYTVTDEELIAALDSVVATMGDEVLTVGQLQVYYWTEVSYFLQQYGSYAVYFGLDYTQPLDTQICALDGIETTWQQYFLEMALDSWASYQSMTLEADESGMTLDEGTQAELDALPETLEMLAVEYGLTDAAELLAVNFGSGCTVESYVRYWELYYKGYQYFNAEYEKIAPTAEEVEAYFVENEEIYAESGITKDAGSYVDVRHVLLFPEGGTTDEETGDVTYSDEEWEACRAEAQALLDKWLAEDGTEEGFAAMANEYSDDGGSNTNGGLYEDVYVGQMVENFENWCFDEARQVGDSGLVQTNYGYHIMYFVGSEDIWFVTAEADLISEESSILVPAAMEKYNTNFDYSAIMLGLIDLS